jgi:N-methylhydantoinase A
MIAAISEITIAEGLDPRESFLVAGGGAAGMTIAEIAREIGCERVLIPRAAGALSAMGGQFTDVVTEFGSVQQADTKAFPYDAIAQVFRNLDQQAEAFAQPLRARGLKVRMEYMVDARYSHQNWDLELPLGNNRLRTPDDVEALERGFTDLHERVHAVAEPGQVVEIRGWRVRVIGELADKARLHMAGNDNRGDDRTSADIRSIYFRDHGWLNVQTWQGDQLSPGSTVQGPALVIEPTTTILVSPGSKLKLTAANTYLMEVDLERAS